MELAENRKAKFDYEILETLQAGIELLGHEVRSAKSGHLNLTGSYILFKDEEAFLFGAQIPSFQPNNAPKEYDPQRTRKLLLKKSELASLAGKKLSGSAIIPLRAYIVHGRIKMELAVARGRKKYDKRETIKKRETKREIERRLKE